MEPKLGKKETSDNLPRGIVVKKVTNENVSESLDELFSCIQRATFVTVKVIHSCNSAASCSSTQDEVSLDCESPLDASSVTSLNSVDSGWKQSYVTDPSISRNTETDAEEKSAKNYKRLRQQVSGESILEVHISSFRRRPPKEYVPAETEKTTAYEASNMQSFSLFRDAQYSVRVFRFLFLRNGNFTVSSDLGNWVRYRIIYKLQ